MPRGRVGQKGAELQNGGRICADSRELAADLRRICAVDGLLRGFCFGLLRAPATPLVGSANPTFFRSPLIQRGTKKTWIWQGEKIAGGLDESGAQKQRTRSCLKTCYQLRRETYAGRCVTNRGERRGQTKETGGPADDRRTGAQTETRTDREVDGQKEAQVADHVS